MEKSVIQVEVQARGKYTKVTPEQKSVIGKYTSLHMHGNYKQLFVPLMMEVYRGLFANSSIPDHLVHMVSSHHCLYRDSCHSHAYIIFNISD